MSSAGLGDVRGEFEATAAPERILWALALSRTRAGLAGEAWAAATATRLLVADRAFGAPVGLQATPLAGIAAVEVAAAAGGGGRVRLLDASGAELDAVPFAAIERDTAERLARCLRRPGAAAALESPLSPVEPGVRVLWERAQVAPGETARGHLRVVAPRELKVARIHVSWLGQETAGVESVESSVDLDGLQMEQACIEKHEEPWVCGSRDFDPGPAERISLDGKGLPAPEAAAWPLAAGVHDFPFEAAIPANAPPSFHGFNISVVYSALGEVEARGVGRLQHEAELRVVRPLSGALAAATASARSGTATLVATLLAGPLAGGAPVRLRVAVQNPEGRRLTPVQALLRRRDISRVGDTTRSRACPLARALAPAPAEGATADLSVSLPPEAVSCDGAAAHVVYELCAHVAAEGSAFAEVVFPLVPAVDTPPHASESGPPAP